MGHTEQYKVVSHQMELILQVGQAIAGELEIDRLLHLIAEKTARVLDADRCSIFVVNREAGLLWTQAATGSARIEIPIQTGIAGAVALSGETIAVDDAYSDQRFNPEVDRASGYQTRTILAGPMYNRAREIIGVFQLINSNLGCFTEGDKRLLGALSGFAGNALEKAMLYDELKRSFNSVLEVLAATVDAKHPYTAGHTERVAEYSMGIARELGVPEPEVEALRVAAYLHDYGKIGIRDAVLTKPGRLTDEEFVEMKLHASKTKEILRRMHFSRQHAAVPAVAGAHHERWDGRGYPDRLQGESIPLGARIMAIADVFDALTSDRDYRKALPFEEVLEMLRADVGAAYDPGVFPAFERYFSKRFAGRG